MASVNEISHEEVVSIRAFTSHLEELHEILELTMNVTTNGYWAFYNLHIRLVKQDLLCSRAQSFHFCFFNVLTPF